MQINTKKNNLRNMKTTHTQAGANSFAILFLFSFQTLNTFFHIQCTCISFFVVGSALSSLHMSAYLVRLVAWGTS